MMSKAQATQRETLVIKYAEDMIKAFKESVIMSDDKVVRTTAAAAVTTIEVMLKEYKAKCLTQ